MADPESDAEPSPKPGKKAPPRGPQEGIVSRSSVQNLVKNRIPRRPTIEAKAVDKLIGYIDQISLRLATKAAELSLQDGRKSIQLEDVDAAYNSIAGETTNPDSVFTAIDKLNTDQIRDLVIAISGWLKEKQPGRRP
jgi:histone H3/H4